MQKHRVVYNEQTKLTANFCNNLAVACWTLGFLTPVLTGDVKVYWSIPIAIGISALLQLAAGRMLHDLYGDE